ncbi:heavy metal-binding domain-containing protein [Dyadobacter sp. NIV53]|uniref:heavy metal-binding domain-containing protein n=1 Tax=Dyadobacter sp. NIV53 TaxID=2861765 RepID=UPI001C87E657|nr:heavy metal-binding domain-containing protein [Dyadobacter sp. NIV53]
MKKLFFAFLIAFCAACSGNTDKSVKEDTPVKTELVATKEFACPMQCEGEKTYTKAGECPVCKMDLKEIALAETDSTTHKH